MRRELLKDGRKIMPLAKSFAISALCLLLTAVFSGFADPAVAQQQEKRIALVVGDGAYAKAPLATAANDAGLIAQNLQAAGFDVIGARDLDADSLRKSFRDFMQKAQASPSDTVAMVYLAGYGVQLAGENYFIPVDASVNRDTDIPIEGLRISDYMRELASVPLKASVIVLDAAREQSFIEGGQPIAGGLALVDPTENMLIAFNAAPGTVVASEPGPYGAYAQALAEMIRTGGLPLPDVFDRVRLRVSETTKGAQVPWDAQKIQVPFSFFDRAPDAPPLQGSADQVAAIRERPIRDLSAHDAFTAALARDTMQGYEDFLGAYASDPLAPRVRAILAARREAIIWRRTYLADTPEAYWTYLRRYPRGPHAWDARRRLTILTAALEPPPAFAVIDYGLPPPPPEEIVFVDRPYFYFGDPVFGFVAPPPPPVYFLAPPPPEFVVLAPPIIAVGAVGLFILPRPYFVPIPAFVRPPLYVAAPANNIIFNNIHNTTVINTVINNPAPSAAAGAQHGAVGPALPAAVSQRAALIQQGKLPTPPSASINVNAKAGSAATTPANLAPSTALQGSTIPKQNALPGAGGTALPQASKGSTAIGTTAPANNLNAKQTPTSTSPTSTLNAKQTPTTTSPTSTLNAKQTPTTTSPSTTLQNRGGPSSSSPSPSSPSPSKPAAALTKPTPPPPPPPKPAPPAAALARPTPPPPPKPTPPPPPPRASFQQQQQRLSGPPPSAPRAAPAAAGKKCGPNGHC
jgi:uncharacterized caspase-like protein